MSGDLKSGDRHNVDAPSDMAEDREERPSELEPKSEPPRDLEKGGDPAVSSANDATSRQSSRTAEDSAPASQAHVCPKAAEAGFSNVKRKGNQIIVDWDGPNDPYNPLK